MGYRIYETKYKGKLGLAQLNEFLCGKRGPSPHVLEDGTTVKSHYLAGEKYCSKCQLFWKTNWIPMACPQCGNNLKLKPAGNKKMKHIRIMVSMNRRHSRTMSFE